MTRREREEEEEKDSARALQHHVIFVSAFLL